MIPQEHTTPIPLAESEAVKSLAPRPLVYSAAGMYKVKRCPGGGRMFVRMGEKVGRNEPCPCGSGQKFKHCHKTEPDLLAWAKKMEEMNETM